jgi:hypothetical protein
MPNNVTNVVYFNAPSMDALLQLYHFIATKDNNGMKITGSIDFNTIILMPNKLDITAGSIISELISIYASYYTIPTKVLSYINDPVNFISLNTNIENINRSIEHLTAYLNTDLEGLKLLCRKYIDNIINYNSSSWYEWCCNNWNTKWNVYNFNPITNFLRNYIEFNTAWSHVEPVLLKLNQLFPHIGIDIQMKTLQITVA